ncbi:MAG: ATP-dependent helicase, partial [Micromonosporaceae bacterium]
MSTAYRLVRRALDVTVPIPDDAQRRVVDHTAGPALVLGGPGTGKTTTLVESVVARIEAGADPERVLVLTFGRRGAARLRQRIAARLGRATAEPVVRTFHGYAFGILRRLAAEHDEPPPRLLTGPEQDLVIRELLASGDASEWPVGLRPALRTRGFAGELRDLLLRAAERGVSPAELAALGRQVGREDWMAAGRFAQTYADVLALRDATTRGTAAYDTAELVRVAAARLAADPELLDAERRRAGHTYVDELHDTDPAQLDLLTLVAGHGGHLVAFADPDSSTYAFRGADPAGVYGFTERFAVAGREPPVVQLTTCWRATPELITATQRVADRLRGPARHRRRHPAPQVASGPQVEVALLRSATQEAAYLAQRLRAAHLVDGVPWSAMAVILRSTVHQLGPVRRALQHAGVPVEVAADELPLSGQPSVAPLLTLLRCALDPARLDEETAVALLHSPLGGADPYTERALRQGLRAVALAAGDRRHSDLLLIDALREPAELAAVDERWAAPAKRVARLLVTAREAAEAPGTTAEDALWSVWQASGLAGTWAAASAAGGPRAAAADRDLDAVMALFETAARFADRLPGAGALAFTEHVLAQQIPADTLAATADRGEAVRLLTGHGAKGLEWELVAIPGVQEGRLPDLRLRGSVLGSEVLVDHLAGRASAAEGWSGQLLARLDEERRLFFVAATRARRRLLVTAVVSGDGEEQPSRFLNDLVEGATDAPHADLPRALTLPGLVAELRTVATDA